jgi:hypothetical protein
VPELSQSQRKIHRQRCFANTAFAGSDSNNGINSGQWLRSGRRLSGTLGYVCAQGITWKEESKD